MDSAQMIFLFTIVLVAIIAAFIYLTRPKTPEWKIFAQGKLGALDTLINSAEINQMKLAMVEIDKLLDYVLKKKKLKGETMGERLKNAQKLFRWEDYQKTWEAHKMRNKLAHEMEFTPKASELKKSYQQLRKSILDLM